MTLAEQMQRRRARLSKRRIPAPLRPTGIQLSYFQQLRKVFGSAKARVDDRVVPLLKELTTRAAERRRDARVLWLDDGIHLDALDPTKRVNKLMDRISESFYREWDPERTAGIVKRVGEATSEFQKVQLRRQLAAAIGIDPLSTREPGLAQKVRDFTGANVSLIKRVADRYLGDVEQTVTDGIRAGSRWEEIASQLEEQFDLTEQRAKLIARDQVGKFFGELNQFRQESLGLERYIWRTVRDERVRDAHDDFNGETYSWDDPPGDGSPQEGTHPGTAINCRCYAEAVIGELDDE